MQKDNKQWHDHEFDQFFRSELEHHEVPPSSSIWKRLQNWQVVTAILGTRAQQLIQIAACLLIVSMAVLVLTRNPWKNLQQAEQTPVIIPPFEHPLQNQVSTSPPVKQTDFVLDIEGEKIDQDVRKEIIEKELDEYLSFLLADENEFADMLDSSEMSDYLKPVEQLPVDEMFALQLELEQREFTILAPLETKITLPHRFLKSDAEIEDYLLIYENNQLRSQ